MSQVSTARRRHRYACVLAALLALALAACGSSDAGDAGSSTTPSSSTVLSSPASTPIPTLTGDITVLAAASLTDVFGEIGDSFMAANPGTKITFSFGASSELATQVIAGAPADVLATANTSTMTTVTDADAASGEPTVFVRNVLEIAVPKDNPGNVTKLSDLANPDLVVALCDPAVPCGSAAKKLLDLVGITVVPDTLETDVRAALTKVQTGEVDAALVYKTDVEVSGDSVVGIPIPEADQVINDYPIVGLADASNPELAAAFIAYVLAPESAAVFEKAGFLLPS